MSTSPFCYPRARCGAHAVIYCKRRDALLHALADRLPRFEPAGVAAGLHLMAHLPDHLDERRVVEAARAHGVV